MTERIAAAIGNFDGVHVGHQSLLAAVRHFAEDLGCAPGVVVFDPHPRRYFRRDDPPFLLTSFAERERLLKEEGMEHVIALTFDKDLASLAPEDFVKATLKEHLRLSGVMVGTDFRFGADRAGDASALSELCKQYGISFKSFTPVLDQLAHREKNEAIKEGADLEKIGSTGIRNALVAGDMARAAAMLGRPWRVSGDVQKGQQLGRTLNFPTANVTLGELISPRVGVYAVRTHVDGQTFDAVANYGRRPTVGGADLLLEVHLFDFEGDLYGKPIDVDFVSFIRPEMKFDGLDDLKAQIQKDCDTARHRLSVVSSTIAR
ncbi:MAG: bifunctional riboflavin kinase/FAD synthetase [Pseudomonadota bacterium]